MDNGQSTYIPDRPYTRHVLSKAVLTERQDLQTKRALPLLQNRLMKAMCQLMYVIASCVVKPYCGSISVALWKKSMLSQDFPHFLGCYLRSLATGLQNGHDGFRDFADVYFFARFFVAVKK